MPNPSDESMELALVPRVKGFTNQYVTKGSYDNGEDAISRLAVMVFNPVTGNLVYRKEYPDATKTTPIVLNKSMINLESATVVMFANIPLSDIRKPVTGSTTESTTLATDNVTLSTLKDYTCHFAAANTVLSSPPSSGFPMVGATAGINLTSTSTDQVVVNLKVLYSKISFNISVANGTENTGTVNPSFTLNNYKVFNASTATKLSYPKTIGEPERDIFGNILKDEGNNAVIATETTATASTDYAYLSTSEEGFAGTATGTATLGSTNNNISFTFYVSEGRFNHNSDLTGIYPDDSWLVDSAGSSNDDVKGYADLSDAEKALPENKLNGVKYFYDDYIQQYKPKLAEVSTGAPAAGLATYVLLNGSYTDYRGTVWNVAYKVYLGKDNAHNFHVDRNSEYINNITIKGIRNNDSYGAGDVWVDHRVNVSTTDPSGMVTITRETLIDSHIEVRPLRVKWTGTTYDGVRVYLPMDNGALVDWIGIERFTGDNCLDGAAYCYVGGQAIGKRKYFTTSLIDELQSMGGEYGVHTSNNQKYIYLLNGECAWIYFDENTTGSPRTADIKLEFYKSDGKTVSETYRITQAAIQTVSGQSIETYEEYLHSYDSIDKYNLSTTPADYTQQGFAWGLSNTSVSGSQIVSATALPGLNYYAGAQYVKDIRYDFWHKSDGNYNVYSSGNSWGALSDDAKNKETGLAFTNRATENLGITIIDMGTKPSNAYQYCLSKNKFKEDALGNHTLDIHWYMPDVHELESVLKANSSAADFKTDAYYWSSQPSFTDQLNSDVLDYLAGVFGGEVAIIDENVEYARAASSTSTKGADVLRTANNRIRCFYSAEGIKNVDMSERVPDGLGGNFTFWMKAWTEGRKNTAGFFNYLLPAPPEPTGDTQTSTVPDVTIPTKANSQSASAEFTYIVTEGKNGQIEGFEKDPGAVANWREYSTVRGYYYVLTTYPGLTEFTLTGLPDWQGVRVSKPTETRKSIIQTSTKTSKVEKTQSLPSTFALNPLNEKLTITFDQCDGSTVPVFTYDELYSEVKTTSVQYWNKPVYTGTEHQRNPETKPLSKPGTDSASGSATRFESMNKAKQNAFEGSLGNGWNGAYEKAKKAALNNLQNEFNEKYAGAGWTMGTVTYTELSWNTQTPDIVYSNENSGWTYSVDCKVTVTAYTTLTKAGSIILYTQTSGGEWTDASTTTERSGPTVNTDQLRVYCGNSFTISVSDSNYEITKIKVYYSGDNKVASGIMGDGIFNQRQTDVYARFVTPNILSDDTIVKEKEIYVLGSSEPLQLPGMDYSDDGSTGWQQWTGDGQSSVTLVLADYSKVNNVISNLYKYEAAKAKLSESIIIDRIEVKCAKKAVATTE